MTTTSAVNGTPRARAANDPSNAESSAQSPDASLLPEPADGALGGDSISDLAALLTQADEQDRTQARTLEQTADEAATKADDNEVEQMQQKAEDDRSAALWSGAGEVVGGGLSLAAAFAPAPADATGGGPHWHGALEAGAKASPGIGTLAAAYPKANAEEAEANAAKYTAQSQASIRSYDEAHDDAQSANESIQKVEQFLSEIQQTQNAARLSAASYRA